MDQCLPRGWRPILREIRPPTEWVKASHPQVQGRPTGHRHHRRRHIEPMGRVKRVGMMTTWECQRRCYWLTAAVYVVLVVLTFYLVVPSQIESGSQIDHLPFFLTQTKHTLILGLYHLFLLTWFFIFNNEPYSSVLLALAISYNFLEIWVHFKLFSVILSRFSEKFAWFNFILIITFVNTWSNFEQILQKQCESCQKLIATLIHAILAFSCNICLILIMLIGKRWLRTASLLHMSK